MTTAGDHAPPRTVTARAPAKINLSLRVGPRRADGFHSLATVFHAVHLDDLVTATPVPDASVSVEVRDEAGAEVPGLPTDHTNLAVRAALLLRTDAGLPGCGAHLSVRKAIPVAGGMAGGSADAAAALVACAALWGTGYDRERLVPLAARLGSDVPFALYGTTAVGTGRGDEVAPVACPSRLDWVVATARTGQPTPGVYAALDARRARAGAGDLAEPAVDPRLLAALRHGPLGTLARLLDNDLEAAVVDLRPELAVTIAAGRAAGALAGLVSGSGPTVVFLVEPSTAGAVAAAVGQQQGVAGVRHVTGPAPGAGLVG